MTPDRFKPKRGQPYWCWVLHENPEIKEYYFLGDDIDIQRLAFGNCFRSHDECAFAIHVRDKLGHYLKGLHE
jgi:hypothetical protein